MSKSFYQWACAVLIVCLLVSSQIIWNQKTAIQYSEDKHELAVLSFAEQTNQGILPPPNTKEKAHAPSTPRNW